ncbi:AsmA protein [Shimia gijangensis]|uniref:AsmA protein n=1 Tax=Shimia gijangensis TaxID=1470563 RepID=A0A1M6IA09_9RHOB|nr:AsmA family protein [Shimia gijangensis]SHJ31280.1 AsmA protein [Shimia gijangensis]
MRLIRILLMVVVALVIGLVVLVIALPGEKIARIAADQVKSYTGRDLVFDGKVGISWYPVFGVATGPVSLSNAEWSDAGPMFRAESAAIGVDVMSLIGGDIRVTRIEAVKPDVLLEVAKDGRANWELFGNEAASAAPAGAGQNESGGALILENLKIRDARLRYVDHGGESFEIADVDAQLKWPDPRKPAKISLTLRPADDAVTVTATVNDLEALMNGQVAGVVAEMQAAGAKVTFDGRAGIAPQLGGLLDASVPNPDKLMAALGLPAAGIAGPASMRGQITYTKDGRFTLREGSLTALGNSLSAQADVATAGRKPVVTAQFVAGKLDLSAFGNSGGDAQSDGGDTGWSKAAIDASGLAAIDGEIALAAEAIDLGNLKFGRSRMVVKIDNSRAVFLLNELNAYEGQVTGQFVANNRSGLSVGGKMKVAGVELKSVLKDTMEISRFSGKAAVDFSFLGVGQSVHAIMNSLKGDASVKVGQGTIAGIDLDRLLRGIPGGGTTVFDALTGTAVIEKGVLSNDDLLLELPSVIAKGEGVVGLGTRTIDYLFTPQIRSSDDQGLAIPVLVKGSWDDPSIRPQLDKALGVDLEAEKEKLKDEADAALKDKLNEELNLAPDDERSTEEAIQDKLEDEVKDKLLDLLGGGD